MKTININISTLLLCQAVHFVLATPVILKPKLLLPTFDVQQLLTTTIRPQLNEDGIAIVVANDHDTPVKEQQQQQHYTANPETLNSRNRISSSFDADGGGGGDDGSSYIIGMKPVDVSQRKTTAASSADIVVIVALDKKQTENNNNNDEEKPENKNYYYGHDDNVVKNKISYTEKKWIKHNDAALSANENENESRQMFTSLNDRIFSNLMANNKLVNLTQSRKPIIVNSTTNLSILHFPFAQLISPTSIKLQTNIDGYQSPWKIYGEGTEAKFPPFIERIVQRIQHYFSIYKYEDLSRPPLYLPPQDGLEVEESEPTPPVSVVVVALIPHKNVTFDSTESKTEKDGFLSTQSPERAEEDDILSTLSPSGVDESTIYIRESTESISEAGNENGYIQFG